MLSVILFINITLHAQIDSIQVQKSKIIKDETKASELGFTINDGNGGFFSARNYFGGLMGFPKGYHIEHYDASLNLIQEYDYDVDIRENGLKEMFIKNDTLYLIEIRRDRKNHGIDYNILSSKISDKINFTSKKIFSISQNRINDSSSNDYMLGGASFSNPSLEYRDPKGEVYFSKNKNYIAFSFNTKREDEFFHLVKVYDSNFNLIYEKESLNKKNNHSSDYKSLVIDDNDGTVYLLGGSYKKSSKSKGNDISYAFYIHKINASGIEKEFIRTGGSRIGSMKLINNNQKLICVGFFSEIDNQSYRGVAFYELDKNEFKVKVKNEIPFPEQFMIDRYGEERLERKIKKDKGLESLAMRDLYIDNKGNILFTAEEYYVENTLVVMDGKHRYSKQVYHYNDILAGKINSEGNLDWVRNINKLQNTKGKSEDYLSFVSLINNNGLFIFLNAEDKVKKLRDDRIEFEDTKIKNLNLYAIEILPSGKFDYKQIINYKDSNITYKIEEGIILDNYNAVILEGDNGKKKRLIKLSL